MTVIENFSNKYSNIFMENSELLQDRKLYPPAVIKYANANKNLVLLAVENKTPIGFIIGYKGENKNSILTIYVEDTKRSQKIGTLMVNSLIQQNKNNLWTVRLRSIDYPLAGFFEKCSFTKITELNLYEKNESTFSAKAYTLNHLGNFVISIAEPKHIPQLMEIEKKSFEPFWLRTKKEWKTILEDEDAIVYILEGEMESKKKEIIGFSHNSINTSNGMKEGQYIRIAVKPNYRRAGLATILTKKAFEYFERHKVKKVYLSTVRENDQLNSMYKKWGFTRFDSDMILGRDGK